MSVDEMEARNEAIEYMVGQLNKAYQEGSITREQLAMQKTIIYGNGGSNQTPPIQQPVTVTLDASGIERAMGKTTLYATRPWARTKDEQQFTYASLQAEARAPGILEHLREEVLEKAKSSSLSPMEVLALQYLLFYDDTPDEARMLLAVIILRTPIHSRYLMHNWGAIAPQMFPSDVDQHGYMMEKLNYPLFPPVMCRLLNEKIFAAHFGAFHGGGPGEEEEVRKIYRREDETRPLMSGGSAANGFEALNHLIQEAVRKEMSKAAPPPYERQQPQAGKQGAKAGKPSAQGPWNAGDHSNGAKN